MQKETNKEGKNAQLSLGCPSVLRVPKECSRPRCNYKKIRKTRTAMPRYCMNRSDSRKPDLEDADHISTCCNRHLCSHVCSSHWISSEIHHPATTAQFDYSSTTETPKHQKYVADVDRLVRWNSLRLTYKSFGLNETSGTESHLHALEGQIKSTQIRH